MATTPRTQSTYQRAMSAAVRTLMARTPLPGGGRTTISELARGLGERQPTLSRKLGGTRAWTLDDQWAVASHFGVPVTTLVQMMEDERDHQARVDRTLS